MQTFLLNLVRRAGLWLVVAAVAFIFIYYIGFGLAFYQRVDDNPNFAAKEVTQGGSAAVDTAAALITREVDTHDWVANNPWFMPGAWLTRTPAFQQGIVYGLSRFSIAMTDQLARARGSSAVDPDLDQAAGYLKYPGDVWVFNFKNALLPTATSAQQYRSARKALLAYNARLAKGEATLDKRADNLQATIDSIAADLGSQSALISDFVLAHGGELLEFDSNKIYFATKGRLYAYYLIVRDLGKDFAPVIKERGLETVWGNAVNSLREAATLNPLIIMNGKADGEFVACHLCAQGFWLLRARTQLREVTSVLAK